MCKVLIYHNPHWGKSRESVKILDKLDQDYIVVDYIKNPPSPNELESLAKKMGIKAKEFIRSKEVIFTELDLKPHLDNDSILFKYMSENPKLIERPILVKGDKAVLGRLSEKVYELLNS